MWCSKKGFFSVMSRILVEIQVQMPVPTPDSSFVCSNTLQLTFCFTQASPSKNKNIRLYFYSFVVLLVCPDPAVEYNIITHTRTHTYILSLKSNPISTWQDSGNGLKKITSQIKKPHLKMIPIKDNYKNSVRTRLWKTRIRIYKTKKIHP